MAIKAVIDRLEENKAVLILEDHQKLIINKSDLPDIKEGDTIFITFSQSNNADNDLAKNLLNQVLNKNKINET